jgi:2,4-dienoyl-CoA reductase-like NADH-dependent reductase (Old Yellow Enzyme family)
MSTTATRQSFYHLFSAFELGSVTLKNRIFVPGHMTMMVDAGVPNADQAACYEARAYGGSASNRLRFVREVGSCIREQTAEEAVAHLQSLVLQALADHD